jgi:hypothetical protein
MGFDRNRQFTEQNRQFIRLMAKAVKPYAHNYTDLTIDEVDRLGRSWICAWICEEILARWAALGASFLMEDMHLPGKTVEEVSATLEKLIEEYDADARDEGYESGAECSYDADCLARARAWLRAGEFAYWLLDHLVSEHAADIARDSALSYVESGESSNDVKVGVEKRFDEYMKVFATIVSPQQ